MRNDLCLGSAASRGSGTAFASTSRLPTISAALMASLVFAVALGASGSARAACAGGGSAGTGVHTASAPTGVHTTTTTAPSGGTGVHGVSSCGTSNRTITSKVATTGGLAGVDPKTHTSPQHVSGTKTNATSNSHPTTTVHASANLHGTKLR
jgi:hypothetical protein